MLVAYSTVDVISSLQSDVHCRLVIEDIGGGRCRQTLEGQLSINVGWGVGPLAERVVGQQLEKVYRSIPIVAAK